MAMNDVDVIILYDHLFERYVVFWPDGVNRVNVQTFEEAVDFVKHFKNLHEVPVNSVAGRAILKRIGQTL